MTTQEIATRLVELYNEGNALQAEEELYAGTIISHEQDASRNATGKAAVMEKTKQAHSFAKTVNKAEGKVLGVNNNSFLVRFEMDMILKDDTHMIGGEYAFYLVEDGKVTQEYFFAN
jgi:hypothetical protein